MQVSLSYLKPRKKLALSFSNGNGKHIYQYLDISVEPQQWDAVNKKIVNHPQAQSLNIYLQSILSRAQMEMLALQSSRPTRNMPPSEVRDIICGKLFFTGAKDSADFITLFNEYINKHTIDRTRELYLTTLRKVVSYDAHPTFDDITAKWLDGFRSSFVSNNVNYQNIHIRNIRTVFNYALNEGYTVPYPFRTYNIKNTETIMRDLSVVQLRRLFSLCCDGDARVMLDMFKLMFLLIGINAKDMWALRPQDYSGGRIKYVRAKTNKPYSIKVEQAAAVIIKKYQGGKRLLSPCERFATHREFNRRMNEMVRAAAQMCGIKFDVTTYYARYSWATIAYNDLGISMDVVEDALGHTHGNRVTAGYIHISQRTIDEANKRVIDYVLEG